jgi:ParB/RepB/Spo0J family partition protein
MNNTIPVVKLISEGNVRANTVSKKSLEYKALKSNIAKIGIQTPITYRVNDKGEYVIINGHQRVQISKDLKLTEIPAFESNGQVDDITKQVSTNMFTVPMSHLDASFAIDKLVEEGAITTRKALSSHFGKSIAWVDTALALCNIHFLIKDFLAKKEVDMTIMSPMLKEISKSSMNQQILAVDGLGVKSAEYNDFVVFLDDYSWNNTDDDNLEEFLTDLASNLESDETKWKYICDVIGEDTFRACEEKADMVPVYDNVLFEEFAKDQFCDDTEFLREIFLSETAIGQYLDCPVLMNDDYVSVDGYEDTVSFDFANKVSTLKSNIKKETGVPFSNVTIQAWNGNVFNSKLYVTINETAVTEDVKDDEYYEEKAEKKDPDQLKYNKVNKWAQPFVCDYVRANVDTNARDKDNNRIVLNWLIHDLGIGLVIDKPYPIEVFDSHPIATSKTDEELLTNMTKYWFDKHWTNADFNIIANLLDALNLETCYDIVTKPFMKEISVRKEYFKAFSKDELAVMTKNSLPKTKAEAVDNAASKTYKSIPRKELLFTNKGSGTDSIRQY